MLDRADIRFWAEGCNNGHPQLDSKSGIDKFRIVAFHGSQAVQKARPVVDIRQIV